MTVSAPPRFVLRGYHVLLLLLTFFGAVIAVDVGFAVIAVRSFPGEDVRRSYLQGLNYNDTLADRRAQAALGWRATAVLSGAPGEALLLVGLSDKDGAPLSSPTVTGDLRRPADARFDRALTFTRQGDGRYAARVGALESGRWHLRARAADAAGGALDFEADLQWPASH
jgi:nitrogen fixation protein FixH